MLGKYLLLSSFAVGKLSAFSPNTFTRPLILKAFCAKPLSSHTKKIEVPNESYIDFLSESPYTDKISNLFGNKGLSIIEDFLIDLDPHNWENQIEASKEEFYTKIRADSKGIKDQLWNLLNLSVVHSIDNYIAKLSKQEFPATRLIIKFDTHSLKTAQKPQWHFDHRKAHMLCNLFGEHFTLYRGPARCGTLFRQFYELERDQISKLKIIEAPLGKYIFATQAKMPVCHALPYKKQKSGRIVLVLFAGEQQWILENTLHVCAD